jgi:hypothetical protein
MNHSIVELLAGHNPLNANSRNVFPQLHHIFFPTLTLFAFLPAVPPKSDGCRQGRHEVRYVERVLHGDAQQPAEPAAHPHSRLRHRRGYPPQSLVSAPHSLCFFHFVVSKSRVLM